MPNIKAAPAQISGISILSKSFNGRASVPVAMAAIKKLFIKLLLIAMVEIKTAVKQAILPAIVLSLEIFRCCLPQNFPTRLARPSPRAKAIIPILASLNGKIRRVLITPIERVTGPSTNFPLSRSRAAKPVMLETIKI